MHYKGTQIVQKVFIRDQQRAATDKRTSKTFSHGLPLSCHQDLQAVQTGQEMCAALESANFLSPFLKR